MAREGLDRRVGAHLQKLPLLVFPLPPHGMEHPKARAAVVAGAIQASLFRRRAHAYDAHGGVFEEAQPLVQGALAVGVQGEVAVEAVAIVAFRAGAFEHGADLQAWVRERGGGE